MSRQTLLPHLRSPAPGSPDRRLPDVTVVVPTRNERDNISTLVARLERVCPELELETLFVDDSTDDTPDVIRDLASRSSRSFNLMHRVEKEREGGLGGGVLA